MRGSFKSFLAANIVKQESRVNKKGCELFLSFLKKLFTVGGTTPNQLKKFSLKRGGGKGGAFGGLSPPIFFFFLKKLRGEKKSFKFFFFNYPGFF